MTKPRILFYDLETSLQLAAIFDLRHNDYIDPSALVSERHIISGAWKWAGEKKVHAVSVLDDPKRFSRDPHDDRYVVETLHGVLSEADIIVAHNGDCFDKKWLDTRILVHGLSPLPPITSVDTLKIAKNRFYLNSNKLDYIAKLLKAGGKIQTTPGLWMKALQGDKAAIREMVTYNKNDVVILEKVFEKLAPYSSFYPNIGLHKRDGCPRCGSSRIQSRGVHRAISRVYRRFFCADCPGWFRSEINEKDYKPRYRVL